jgi:hypothetical protein
MTLFRRLLIPVLLATGWLLAAVPAHAQESPEPAFGEGMHAFRRILYDRKFGQILEHPGQIWENPSGTVLIVLGEPPDLGTWLEKGSLLEFVNRGGAVLVATDRPTPARLFRAGWQAADVRRFEVGVVGQPVILWPGSRSAYQDYRDCPLVRPVAGGEPPLFRTSSDQRVATNRPGYLEIQQLPPSMMVLAHLPDESYHPQARRDERLPFAAGGTLGNGRLLVLSDHSVFINDMLLRSDNDNFEFTRRSVDWLKGPENRQRILLYEDGQVVTDLYVPLQRMEVPPGMPLPRLEARFDDIERRLAELDDEGTIPATLEGELAKKFRTQGHLLMVLAILATLGLLGYGTAVLLRNRRRIDSDNPLPAVALATAGPPLLHQRQEAMLRDNNLGEHARDLARDVFAEVVPAPPAGRPLMLPVVEVHAGWWRRRSLRRLVHRLWLLAYSPVAQRLGPGEWPRFLTEVQLVKTALANGTLRIHVPA